MEKPKTRAYRSKKIDQTSKKSKYKIKLQKIYESMACMSFNVEFPRRNYGYSLQLNNWILDSCATCHMTPEISDFILGSLVETDNCIKVADVKFFIAKKQYKLK